MLDYFPCSTKLFIQPACPSFPPSLPAPGSSDRFIMNVTGAFFVLHTASASAYARIIVRPAGMIERVAANPVALCDYAVEAGKKVEAVWKGNLSLFQQDLQVRQNLILLCPSEVHSLHGQFRVPCSAPVSERRFPSSPQSVCEIEAACADRQSRP